MFSQYSRQNILESFSSEETYDLLVVGGGITGAGVARDASSRGLKVLVVEANDFAVGTSSRSSKLVHGGIRYLENFEFGLVHEALTERKILLETAPHMVRPLRFVLPVYETSRVGLLKMELGMILYDILSVFEAPELHEVHGTESTAQIEPLLKQKGLKGCVVYSDAYMDDDRLVLETLRSASQLGAHCVNYVKATTLQQKEAYCEVGLVDVLSGKTYQVRAHQVAGCVGPWTDLFASEMLPAWKKVLRPTKGVHLIFSREKLPVQQAVVMAVESRIIFVIPRGEVVIVGTTDTDFKDQPQEVLANKADVEYLLAATNNYFPGLHLTKADIVSCYSGVRPLVQDGAQSEGKTSREHQIFHPSDRITLAAGGKYTTYRSMAEEIVDAILAKSEFSWKMKFRPSNTKTPLNHLITPERLQRARLQAPRVAQERNVPFSIWNQIVERHGEEAYSLLFMLERHEGSWQERLWKAEAEFAIRYEMCLNLVDFYWRRSPLFLFQENNGLQHLSALSGVFTQLLGWSEKRRQEEEKKVLEQCAHEKHALTD